MTELTKIQAVLDAHSHLPLECDGFTRVLSYALTQAGIGHVCYSGVLECDDCEIPHYWIRIGDYTIDLAVRMWFGDDKPHGIFKAEEHGLLYKNACIIYIDTTKAIYDILCNNENRLSNIINNIVETIGDFK